MKRTCPECGTAQTVRPFQLWSGRCDKCASALTMSARVDDFRKPPPTSTEVIDFLRYMDELNTIRSAWVIANRFTGILMVAHCLLWAGVAAGWVDPRFGLFLWATVGILFLLSAGLLLKQNCPRCQSEFRYQKVWGFRIPSSTKNACANCGLRALSQSDINRSGIHADRFSSTTEARDLE